MSLARAFTTRRGKMEDVKPAPYIGRAASQRAPNAKPIMRQQISLPVALISTTNMLSYEAPDIEGTPRIAHGSPDMPSNRSVSGNSSVDEGEHSDHSSTSGRSQSQETDATSVEDFSPVSPEPNHLSAYFKPGVDTSMHSYKATKTHSRTTSTVSSQRAIDSPMVPSRAMSHSKQAHVLSHKRSVQRMNGPPSPRSTVDSMAFSDYTQPSKSASHPFGKELEQLTEAVEDYGHLARDVQAQTDQHVMRAKGLIRFCAAEYMQEIAGAYTTAFAEDFSAYQPVAWI